MPITEGLGFGTDGNKKGRKNKQANLIAIDVNLAVVNSKPLQC
jgi:hypothetical protein